MLEPRLLDDCASGDIEALRELLKQARRSGDVRGLSAAIWQGARASTAFLRELGEVMAEQIQPLLGSLQGLMPMSRAMAVSRSLLEVVEVAEDDAVPSWTLDDLYVSRDIEGLVVITSVETAPEEGGAVASRVCGLLESLCLEGSFGREAWDPSILIHPNISRMEHPRLVRFWQRIQSREFLTVHELAEALSEFPVDDDAMAIAMKRYQLIRAEELERRVAEPMICLSIAMPPHFPELEDGEPHVCLSMAPVDPPEEGERQDAGFFRRLWRRLKGD